MVELNCDYCGRDLPAEAARDASKAGEPLLCGGCKTRVWGFRFRRRAWVVAASLAAFVAGILLGRSARDWLPAGDSVSREPPSADALRAEMQKLRQAFDLWSADVVRRVAELSAELPAESSRGDLAEVMAAVERIRASQGSLAWRLRELEARLAPPLSPLKDPEPPQVPDPLPEAPRPEDPAALELLGKLRDADPRRRLAALSTVGPDHADRVAPLLTGLLSDEYGYVRREAARVVAHLKLRQAAPALLERMASETDIVVKNQVCDALGALSGIPYDARSHEGEAFEDLARRWREAFPH